MLCTTCNRELPAENFHRTNKVKSGLTRRCKECAKTYHAARYKGAVANGLCPDCRKPHIGDHVCCPECREKHRVRMCGSSKRPEVKESHRRTMTKLKLDIFKAYGGPVCACCGETRIQFLSIDHINGGGYRHVKQVGHLYQWLKRNDYPSGYRVLCMNCNFARRFGQSCPHEKERTDQPRYFGCVG